MTRALRRDRRDHPRRALLLLHRASARLGTAVLAFTLGGCATMQNLPPRDNADPWTKVVSLCPSGSLAYDIERPFFYRAGTRIPRPPEPWRRPRFYPNPPRGKIYPPLLRRIAALARGSRDEPETLLVTYRETEEIPRFPVLNEKLPRNQGVNPARLAEAQLLVQQIEIRRDSAYAAEAADLMTNFAGTVLHRHWLTHSMLIAMPLGNVPGLASRPNVLYIQPRVGVEPPPSCPATGSPPDNGSSLDDPVQARSLMQSDSFRNLGLGYGYMSLLDTGVWTGHTQLSGVTFGIAGDCVHGLKTCVSTASPGYDTSDQYSDGHGTSSAALLVGDASLGSNWTGALDITLDYFQVFESTSAGLVLDADAVLHGFEVAVSNLDRVIVADLVSQTPDRAAVAMSANNAYAAGAVVVAANGNDGPGSKTVASPASSPLVLGVGSRDLLDLTKTEASQSLGPASGDRIKPDIQAPTAAEAARLMESGCKRTDLLHTHGGTSGSTPFAGAAAGLIRNWMKAGSTDVEPGNVYAGMILAGRHHGTNLNNTEGAGLIELPTGGCAWWGTGVVWTGQNWRVSIDLGGMTADSLEAALWWPELPAVTTDGEGETNHNNIDLALYDPGGTVAAKSEQDGSVFERATAAINGSTKTWTLEIRGMDFYDPSVYQIVYWAAAARLKR